MFVSVWCDKKGKKGSKSRKMDSTFYNFRNYTQLAIKLCWPEWIFYLWGEDERGAGELTKTQAPWQVTMIVTVTTDTWHICDRTHDTEIVAGSSLTLPGLEDVRRSPEEVRRSESRVKWGSVSVEDHLMLPLGPRRERRQQSPRRDLTRTLFRIRLSQNNSEHWLG